MTPVIMSLLVKVSLLLAVGLIASASLRSYGSSARHQVLAVTLGSCLLLPVFMLVAPRWDVRVLPPTAVATVPSTPLFSPAETPRTRVGTPSSEQAIVVASADRQSFGWIRRAWLPLVWAFGFLAVLVWLVAGRIRLRRIASGSWSLTGEDWERVLLEESRGAGVTKPVRLLSSSVVSTPLTWGSRAPIILLPEDALDWPEAHRRVVLRHELAHIARGDALSQLIAGFVCALYWFHPLIWITERRLRAERERACDDRVVSLGTPAPEYAAHLLEVARSARSFGAPGFLSVAMARPSQLEGRLLAVLNESRRRGAPSRGARIGGLLASLLIVASVSAFRAVPRVLARAPEARVAKTVSIADGNAPSRDLPVVTTTARPPTLTTGLPAFDSTFERSVPARDGGTLTLDLATGGRVTITGWDKKQILVQASLGGRDWRDTDVTLTPVEGGARLATEYTGRSGSQSSSHRFEINVPRNFNVQIKSAGGGVTINGVDGYFSGTTGGGEIEIRSASGRAEIRTGGGDIRVSDSRLTGSVSTGGGEVVIQRVTGNFAGYSGSGPVTYISSDGGSKTGGGSKAISSATNEPVYVIDGVPIGVGVGSGRSMTVKQGTTVTTYVDDGAGKSSTFGAGGIRMNYSGGAISLPEAPDGARVSTGGGAIRIGPSAGEVYASTGGGPIEIGPASGSVEAHTGAGDVTISLTGSENHSVDVTSGKGRVVLVVPRDLSAKLELESAYTDNLGHETRIESDWPLTVTSTKDWDASHGTPRKYVRARQTIGHGGGLIRVRTVNGNVVLRRGD